MLLNGFIFAKYKRYLDTEPWHWFEMAYELNRQSYARYFYPCDVILLPLNSVQFELRKIFFLTESRATDDILRLTNDETSHFAAKGWPKHDSCYIPILVAGSGWCRHTDFPSNHAFVERDFPLKRLPYFDGKFHTQGT